MVPPQWRCQCGTCIDIVGARPPRGALGDQAAASRAWGGCHKRCPLPGNWPSGPVPSENWRDFAGARRSAASRPAPAPDRRQGKDGSTRLTFRDERRQRRNRRCRAGHVFVAEIPILKSAARHGVAGFRAREPAPCLFGVAMHAASCGICGTGNGRHAARAAHRSHSGRDVFEREMPSPSRARRGSVTERARSLARRLRVRNAR